MTKDSRIRVQGLGGGCATLYIHSQQVNTEKANLKKINKTLSTFRSSSAYHLKFSSAKNPL